MHEKNLVKSIAVAIPCYNEAVTIAKVVSDFKSALPQAAVYVVDNNSTDGSPEIARKAGAHVLRENRQGKGYVMQTILEQVKADVIVVVDGDDTYPAEEAHKLIAPIQNGEADMVVGTRLENAPKETFEDLNRIGNHILSGILNFLFRTRFKDVLSGYRAFSRRFTAEIPILTGGFETEAELTVQALTHSLIIKEVPITYRSRPDGSQSKLRPFRDGYRILLTIAVLLRDRRPLVVFGILGLFFIVCGIIGGVLVTLLGILLLGLGFVLNAINTRFKEMNCLMRRLK